MSGELSNGTSPHSAEAGGNPLFTNRGFGGASGAGSGDSHRRLPRKHQQQRKALPIFDHREEIIRAVKKHQVQLSLFLFRRCKGSVAAIDSTQPKTVWLPKPFAVSARQIPLYLLPPKAPGRIERLPSESNDTRFHEISSSPKLEMMGKNNSRKKPTSPYVLRTYSRFPICTPGVHT